MPKFTVTFKDPDGPYNSIRDAVRESVEEPMKSLSRQEVEELVDSRIGSYTEACSKWFKHGEYVDIEIDTDSGTATVLPAQ